MRVQSLKRLGFVAVVAFLVVRPIGFCTRRRNVTHQ